MLGNEYGRTLPFTNPPSSDGYLHSRESKVAGCGAIDITPLCTVAMETNMPLLIPTWLALVAWDGTFDIFDES